MTCYKAEAYREALTYYFRCWGLPSISGKGSPDTLLPSEVMCVLGIDTAYVRVVWNTFACTWYATKAPVPQYAIRDGQRLGTGSEPVHLPDRTHSACTDEPL